MRVEIREADLYNYPRVVRVVLSDRNLMDLLAQRRVINDEKAAGHGDHYRAYPVLTRYDVEAEVRLAVVVEPNAAHYLRRAAGPGSGLVDEEEVIEWQGH